MSLRSFVAPFVFASVAVSLGCAAAHDRTTPDELNVVEESGDGSAITKKLPAPAIATQRLYFANATKIGTLPFGGGGVVWPYPAAGATSVTSYWVFGAAGGSTFDVSVSGFDDGEPLTSAPMSLGVYYLSGGKWRRFRSIKAKGTAKVTLSPTYDHQWLVTATGEVASDQNNLEISLGCDDGADADGHSACAISQETGDACTSGVGALKCDGNLYCDFGSACGKKGSCAQFPNRSCDDGKTHKPTGTPVCGCDGVTYPNECYAQTAGASIASNAACGAPPTCDWSASAFDATALTSELWRSEDLKFTYRFEADGTFQSIYDRCAAPPGVVHCMIAAVTKFGKWSTKDASVGLTYDDGTFASLDAQTDCKGARRLDGNDYGQQLDALDAGKR